MQVFPHITLGQFYNEVKWWAGFLGLLGFLGGMMYKFFTGVNWVKEIKTNDLHHVQLGLDTMNAGLISLKEELTKQTSAIHESAMSSATIASELKEMRNDFRTFYSPSVQRTPKSRRSHK